MTKRGEARIDLHMHSQHSQSAGDWMLSTLKVQECYSTPRQAYDLARSRGMDYVTLTDHDAISGALEIAHLPGAFISEEITTRIPESGAKMHVVALDINEEIHRTFQSFKDNIYDLTAYLRENNIIHFLAHPFFRMSEQLELEDLEKMLLLFDVFEVKNGGKQLRPDNLMERILDALTPELVSQLADKHNLAPVGVQPWKKGRVAGSDDHGGILIGSPHTICPQAASVQELIQHIARHESRAAGIGGSQLTVAHSILAVAYHHVRQQRSAHSFNGSSLAWNLLGQLYNAPDQNRSLSIASRLGLFLNEHFELVNLMSNRKPLLRKAVAEWLSILRRDKQLVSFLRNGIIFGVEEHEQLFAIHNKAFNHTFARIIEQANQEKSWSLSLVTENLPVWLSLIPMLVPYVIGLKIETRDRPLMRAARRSFIPFDADEPSARILVLTSGSADQLADRRSLYRFLFAEYNSGAEVSIWGLDTIPAIYPSTHNFMPIHHLKPKREDGKATPIPPVLDLVRKLAESDFDAIYVHSLDPLSILGILLASWLHLPVICRYPYEGLRRVIHQGEDHNRNRMLQSALCYLFNRCQNVRTLSPVAAEHARLFGVNADKISIERPVETSGNAAGLFVGMRQEETIA